MPRRTLLCGDEGSTTRRSPVPGPISREVPTCTGQLYREFGLCPLPVGTDTRDCRWYSSSPSDPAQGHGASGRVFLVPPYLWSVSGGMVRSVKERMAHVETMYCTVVLDALACPAGSRSGKPVTQAGRPDGIRNMSYLSADIRNSTRRFHPVPLVYSEIRGPNGSMRQPPGAGKRTGSTEFDEHSDEREVPLFLITTSIASAVGSGNLDTRRCGTYFSHNFSHHGDQKRFRFQFAKR